MKSLNFTKKQLNAFANLHEFPYAEWYIIHANPSRIIMRLTITREMLNEDGARICGNPELYLDFMRNKNAFGHLKRFGGSCDMWEMPLNLYYALEAYVDLAPNYPESFSSESLNSIC